ncbi:cupin domain-containing protein [Roseobacter sp. A03A-229]
MTIVRAGEARIDQSKPGDPLGDYRAEQISDTAGLTQFGAFIEELAPCAWTSYLHWHAEEDEMVLLLSGALTLYEGAATSILEPGDAACWKAGVAIAHRMHNHTNAPARYLVIGTRAPRDKVTYPENDRVLLRDRLSGTRRFTTLSGDPADAL